MLSLGNAHARQLLIEALNINLFGFHIHVGALDHFLEHFNLSLLFLNLSFQVFNRCVINLLELHFGLYDFPLVIFIRLLCPFKCLLRLLNLLLLLPCSLLSRRHLPILLLKGVSRLLQQILQVILVLEQLLHLILQPETLVLEWLKLPHSFFFLLVQNPKLLLIFLNPLVTLLLYTFQLIGQFLSGQIEAFIGLLVLIVRFLQFTLQLSFLLLRDFQLVSEVAD